MSTVYIVTTGSYSAYEIRAVFSDGDVAETYSLKCGGRVEEWALDKWQRVKDHTYWRVRFGSHGGPEVQRLSPDLEDPSDIRVNEVEHHVSTIDHYEDDYTDSLGNPTVRPTGRRVAYREPHIEWLVNVIADDEQHAIKIAAEQVAMAKAQQAGIG